MKIIKRVEPFAHNRWWGQYKCGHCTSVLEVEFSDLMWYSDDDPRGPSMDIVFVCACCKAVNIAEVPPKLPKGELPFLDKADELVDAGLITQGFRVEACSDRVS